MSNADKVAVLRELAKIAKSCISECLDGHSEDETEVSIYNVPIEIEKAKEAHVKFDILSKCVSVEEIKNTKLEIPLELLYASPLFRSLQVHYNNL